MNKNRLILFIATIVSCFNVYTSQGFVRPKLGTYEFKSGVSGSFNRLDRDRLLQQLYSLKESLSDNDKKKEVEKGIDLTMRYDYPEQIQFLKAIINVLQDYSIKNHNDIVKTKDFKGQDVGIELPITVLEMQDQLKSIYDTLEDVFKEEYNTSKVAIQVDAIMNDLSCQELLKKLILKAHDCLQRQIRKGMLRRESELGKILSGLSRDSYQQYMGNVAAGGFQLTHQDRLDVARALQKKEEDKKKFDSLREELNMLLHSQYLPAYVYGNSLVDIYKYQDPLDPLSIEKKSISSAFNLIKEVKEKRIVDPVIDDKNIENLLKEKESQLKFFEQKLLLSRIEIDLKEQELSDLKIHKIILGVLDTLNQNSGGVVLEPVGSSNSLDEIVLEEDENIFRSRKTTSSLDDFLF